LSGIVILELKANVLIQAVFILMNKKHNQVKLPSWKGDGFAMQATLAILILFTTFLFANNGFKLFFNRFLD